MVLKRTSFAISQEGLTVRTAERNLRKRNGA